MALLRRIALILLSVAALAAGVIAPATPAVAAGIPAPTLTSPANDPDVAVQNVVLTWNGVAGAEQYQVQLGRNQDFTNNSIQLPGGGITTATLFEMNMTLPNATYFWRVRAQVGGTWGKYSQPWRFLKEWESVVSVIQVPSSSDPTIEWAPVPGASVYHVIISTFPLTSDDLLNQWSEGCWTNQTSYDTGLGGVEQVQNQELGCDPEPLSDGKQYYWGVAAFDDTIATALQLPGLSGGCGTKVPRCDATFTTGGPFTFKSPTGVAATLTNLATSWHGATATQNPCDADNPCPITPTFSWSPVTGANFYVVSVYLDRDATTLYRDYALFTGDNKSPYPQFTPPDSFADAQPGRPYFWQVESAICGGPGVECVPPSAATQSCPAPVASGATVPTLTGTSVAPPGPGGNQSMQGGTTATVTLTGTNIKAGACVIPTDGVVKTAPTVTANSVSFSYYAPVQGGDVTFQVENADGSLSAASPSITVADSTTGEFVSAISSFDKRSGPMQLVSPADGATVHGRTVTFNWADYIANGSRGTYDPENYELQLSDDPDFNTVKVDISDIDLTQRTIAIFGSRGGHIYWRVNGRDETGNLLTWSAPREVIVNAFAPTVQFASANGIGVGRSLQINFSTPIKGVNTHTLRVVPRNQPASHALAGTLHLGSTPTQYVFNPDQPLAVGGRYVLHISPKLVDNNDEPVQVAGGALRTTHQAHNFSPGWQYSAGWTRHKSSGSFSTSDMEARAGQTATIHVEGANINFAGCTGPDFGSISVSVAGTTHVINEHRSFTTCGVYLWRRALPAGIHTLRVTVTQGVGNFDGFAVR